MNNKQRSLFYINRSLLASSLMLFALGLAKCGKQSDLIDSTASSSLGTFNGSVLSTDPLCAIKDLSGEATLCTVGELTVEKTMVFATGVAKNNSFSLTWGFPQHTSMTYKQLEIFVGFVNTDAEGKKNVIANYFADPSSVSVLIDWQRYGANELKIKYGSLNPQENINNLPYVFIVGVRDGVSTIFYNLVEYSFPTLKVAVKNASDSNGEGTDPSEAGEAETILPAEDDGTSAGAGDSTVSSGAASESGAIEVKDGKLTLVSRNHKSITLSWSVPTTALSNLEYKIVTATKATSLDTVDKATVARTVVDWTKDMTSFTVSDLTVNSTYTFNVLVRSGSEIAAYSPTSFTTLQKAVCEGTNSYYHKLADDCITPLDPATVSAVMLHLDATSLDLADNAEVSSWLDNSDNLFNFGSGSCTNKPRFATGGLGGKPAVVFNNSILFNNSIDIRETPVPKLVTFAVYSNVSGSVTLWAGLENGFAKRRFIVESPSAATPTLKRIYFDASAGHYSESINGDALYETAMTFSSGLAGVAIGAHLYAYAGYCGAYYTNLNLSELLIIDASTIPETDMSLNQIEIYLANKWGVSLSK